MKSFLLICTFAVSGCDVFEKVVGPLPPPEGSSCPLQAGSEESPYQHTVELAATQMPDFSSAFPSSDIDSIIARQGAFSQLRRNAEHLSDQVDIATNNTNMVRITVTYLDPELVQYIILNHYLNDSELIYESDEGKRIWEFNNALNQIMNKLGERNEILFLVTVTSPSYTEQAYNSNVLTVRLPITKLTLINGSGRRINPSHPDYILDTPIDITHGPVSGIVAYPVAKIDQGQCMPSIDKWTNSLTLELSEIKLGETDVPTQVWSIPYRSLLMSDDSYPTPTYDPAMGTPITKLETPPVPHWIPNAQEDSTDPLQYWSEMGRYIWNYMINESHH